MIKIFVENLIDPLEKHVLSPFNFVKFNNLNDTYTFNYTNKSLFKISCELNDLGDGIKLLKLTNNPLKAWIDVWLEHTYESPVDPHIEAMDLSSNDIQLVSMLENRSKLRDLDFSSCKMLTYVNITGCHELVNLNLQGCTQLAKINFGMIKNLETLNLKDCGLSENAMEDILGNYYPTKSGVLNSFEQNFKPHFKCYLDLRGSYINWENRRIASKIRMLLTNNILVLWDNNPPDSIIPAQYYRTLYNLYGRSKN